MVGLEGRIFSFRMTHSCPAAISIQPSIREKPSGVDAAGRITRVKGDPFHGRVVRQLIRITSLDFPCSRNSYLSVWA